MNRSSFRQATLIVLATSMISAAPASAQLISRDGWRAPPTNRASIAFSMKAVEDGTNGAPGTTINSTSIVCGGGATSATGNSNCIILNEATGAISTDQASDGNQDAATTDNSTVSEAPTQADELMDVLEMR